MRGATWKQLAAEGASVWLDGSVRPPAGPGGAAPGGPGRAPAPRSAEELVAGGWVTGLVLGPEALTDSVGSPSQRALLRDLASLEVTPQGAVRRLSAHRAREACDLLGRVYEETGGLDGYVSVDLPVWSPADPAVLLAEARTLWWLVDRPNLLVRIPATEAGLAAIVGCLADGIGVDVAPLVTVESYRRVLDAFDDGLERARAAGRRLDRIAALTSFAVRKVDTEVDARLAALPGTNSAALRGRTGPALARVVYRLREEHLDRARWRSLAAAGARPHRLAWLACGTPPEQPAGSGGRYLGALLAEGVVHVLPADLLAGLEEEVPLFGDMLSGRFVSAQRDLEGLVAAGVPLAEVTDELGVRYPADFARAWSRLLAATTAGLRPAEG
ncbi:transaldolase 1 [Kitasatospora herbaricolor]|uniref:transaldolase family protein n=1 Tax=Kitasatospora herbaricolor TaxID=68217 RepID=UPI00174B8E86|nr:transaldolase family protein [Kitasatospora herbaricolor]MDQ0309883.1 transaldolase [Kitasatospora herbaricolor]GGV32913.1 transaldolase 1 [Kitasatospora herbaricolor]